MEIPMFENNGYSSGVGTCVAKSEEEGTENKIKVKQPKMCYPLKFKQHRAVMFEFYFFSYFQKIQSSRGKCSLPDSTSRNNSHMEKGYSQKD